ncbi:MAG: RNA polymerase subunit sigma [Leptolyngbya sp. PLA2]|nr:RNA polymerase subunit sigma [Leptolyngbya sp.]MCE7971229.1 RNA polymerase subunit sigma [Leptolyngbya sp. PL-A2]MCQ3939587.1 RNA polymerase subunit sigma [cyanobacterium CYA1]MDL1903843.1 RNA polymerase subunit sigma [Synechococcales cyanobacterium CNB]
MSEGVARGWVAAENGGSRDRSRGCREEAVERDHNPPPPAAPTPPARSPHEVTLLLNAASEGDPRASAELLPLVYEELRRLARARLGAEAPGQTLQPTALVHEAYLRLVGDAELQWNSRGHFFGAAALAMRRILVERARHRKRLKHGGGRKRVELTDHAMVAEPPPDDLLALDEALERLAAIDSRKARVVMLRYFAGLSIEETAAALEVAPATVKADWAFSRAWLHRALTESAHDETE